MSEYTEIVKQRIINGNLEKPEEFYPLLVKEIAEQKKPIANFLDMYFAKLKVNSVIDIGGGTGEVISKIKVDKKIVLDKRKYEVPKGYKFINESYDSKYTEGVDIAVFSEFLHLFTDSEIMKMLFGCQSKYIVIIENVYDDFLDLRLRLWSNGRCIEPSFINKLTNTVPYVVNDHYIWIREVK